MNINMNPKRLKAWANACEVEQVKSTDCLSYGDKVDAFAEKRKKEMEKEMQKRNTKITYGKDEELERLISVVEGDSIASESYANPTPVSSVSKKNKPSAMGLHQMENEILKCITIILHDKSLFYYTGRTYRMIADEQELLRLIRSRVSHSAFSSVSVRKFKDLFLFMKADDRLIPRDYEKRLKKSQNYVVLKNGVLNLKKLELSTHSKEYLTFYEIDAEWIEDAVPTRFIDFLEEVSMQDEEIQCRIKEAIGYLLSPINAGKCFFVMGTAPNSGKSTLGNLLLKLIGEEFVISRSTSQIGERFSLGDIQGKLLNMSMDLPKGKLTSAAVAAIKQITGGDRISTEQKYEKMREIQSNMRFLFASNHPVTIPAADDDDAFWDRMVIIPFMRTIPKERANTKILDKLLEEKDEIISYCLTALHEVIRNNYIFSYCGTAEQIKQSWKISECEGYESAVAFVNGYIEITGDSKDSLYSQTIYDCYRQFCIGNQYTSLPYTKFIGWLTENNEGCVKKRIHKTGSNPLSGLTGIRWKNMDLMGVWI